MSNSHTTDSMKAPTLACIYSQCAAGRASRCATVTARMVSAIAGHMAAESAQSASAAAAAVVVASAAKAREEALQVLEKCCSSICSILSG